MNNFIRKVCFLGIILSVVLYFCACNNNRDYIGMSRDEVIASLKSIPRFEVNGCPKVVLCVNSSFRYFDTVDEVKKDREIMTSKQLELAFEKSFRGKRYILLTFDKDIVISKKVGYLNDGP